ncbi:shikimate kinase [Microbacterium marinum]|uniref:Shikimate kinase n=1 Tax=Microbacterium marinum TaxID=421115 RepID=A0A7W7BR66_9MICO|nr:shikimate kinase [Microbacterium marinum]MBB4667319.1 shikimate kinase [Microbacterium marinum]
MTSPEAAALVLVGPMGAGKTSIGKRLAKQLGTTFADTDSLVVREHGPIAALFAEHGEAHFRALERAAVTDALARGGVVSLGGGAVMDAATRADLSAQRVVLLTVAPRVVAHRLGEGAKRPLLADGSESPLAHWQRIFDQRRPLYEQVADITFDTSSGPLERIVTAIADWARASEGRA